METSNTPSPMNKHSVEVYSPHEADVTSSHAEVDGGAAFEKPASNESKDKLLELVELATASAPQENHGRGDSFRTEKSARLEEPGWGEVEVSSFPSRGAYAHHGLAEIHVRRNNDGEGQQLLRIVLDGKKGALSGHIEEYALSSFQARKAPRPWLPTANKLMEVSDGNPLNGLNDKDFLAEAIHGALGHKLPVRQDELSESEAVAVSAALSSLMDEKQQ